MPENKHNSNGKHWIAHIKDIKVSVWVDLAQRGASLVAHMLIPINQNLFCCQMALAYISYLIIAKSTVFPELLLTAWLVDPPPDC